MLVTLDESAGVINVAKACLEAKVPRLVVVSSGGVASPDSSIYKFLNLFGEVGVRGFRPSSGKIAGLRLVVGVCVYAWCSLLWSLLQYYRSQGWFVGGCVHRGCAPLSPLLQQNRWPHTVILIGCVYYRCVFST